MVGNSFCNDETNNAYCNYDGGECCIVNANTDFCFECVCYLLESCAAGNHPLVGNGFCDDDTNIADCEYDGGDCCGYNINSEHCTECTCFHKETCLSEVTHSLVGDGVCNDETNIAECDYDGGDCCGYCVNTEHCEECACLGSGEITNPLINRVCNDGPFNLTCNNDGGDCCVNVYIPADIIGSCSHCKCIGGGVITSPGFPGDYDNLLELTWRIEVQNGQMIQMNFLDFDVEPSSCGLTICGCL